MIIIINAVSCLTKCIIGLYDCSKISYKRLQIIIIL